MQVLENISKEELKKLYDKDFPLWAEINLNLLKEKFYELVDWDNLLEEIEGISKSDLKERISYLVVILEHLYKWDNFKNLVGKEAAGKSWIKSIRNARYEIMALLETYPSLRTKLSSEVEKAWIKSRYRLKIWLERNDYDSEAFDIPKNVLTLTRMRWKEN